MANRIDSLRAPLFVSWQITRDCDLACLHCCTDSAPGKRLPDELSAEEAMRIVGEIIGNEVPYVMLCGGEPLVVPHFLPLAEALGTAGVQLKIETNGQRFDARVAERLARLPIRSIQVSLDGDSQEVYERQRPGGSLAKAHAACRAAREAGLPLRNHVCPDAPQPARSRGGDRARAGARRIPLQHRQAHAGRHRGSLVGAGWNLPQNMDRTTRAPGARGSDSWPRNGDSAILPSR